MKLYPFAIVMSLLVFLAGCGGGSGKGTTPGGNNPPGTPTSPTGPRQIGFKLSGVCFGPFLTGNPDNGSTVSESDLRNYLAYVAVNFNGARSYGSTGGLEKFPIIAKALGIQKVAAGSWLSGGSDARLAANETEIKSLTANCQSGNVDVAVVGNEALENGLTVNQLIAYIARVKAAVPANVIVTTAETNAAIVANPQIIAACDEVWVNVYPFWESVSIDQAMSQIQSDYNQIKAIAGGRKVVISETGWPSDGVAKGAAVPSLANAAKYFKDFVTWANSQSIEFYYFECFDEPWKTAEPNSVGPHWGIWDSTKILKTGMADGFKVSPSPIVPSVPVPIPVVPTLPSFTYTPIANVPQAVNDLGQRIDQEQRNIVTPGGNEWAPGFSAVDQSNFDNSGKLATIVSTVTASSTFSAGIASIKTLSVSDQARVLAVYAKPLYPTWAMNGTISNAGTTDAGYAVEGEIATALTNAVKAAL